MTLREIVKKHLPLAERRHKNQAEIKCELVVQRVENGIPTYLFRDIMDSIDEVMMYSPSEYHDIDIQNWYLERNPLRYHIIIRVE